MSEALIGVGAVLSIAHRPKGGGPLHGHTYEVVAWFGDGDAVELQQKLKAVLDQIDHTDLGDGLSRAEDIGRWVAEHLTGCRIVDVNRPLERIYACVRP